MEYLEKLAASPLFRGMTGAEIRQVLGQLPVRVARYGRGRFVLRAGETVRAMGLVLSGRV